MRKNNKFKKKQKFSLMDRVNYYRSKQGPENRAFAAGYSDSVSNSRIDISLWEGKEDSYLKGVEKGNKTKNKLFNLKF